METRSKTSGKTRKTYADPPQKKTTKKHGVLSHEHHKDMADLYAKHKHMANNPDYEGIKQANDVRHITAHGPGLSALRALKRAGTRRNRKRTMRR